MEAPDSALVQIFNVDAPVGSGRNWHTAQGRGGDDTIDRIENRGMTELVRESKVGRQVAAADLNQVRCGRLQQGSDVFNRFLAFDLRNEGDVLDA